MPTFHSPNSFLNSKSGTALNSIPFSMPVDLTDGSWTKFDPDGLVANVSYSNGINRISWNSLAQGNANYNWGSGTVHRAPRWYKDLEIDGSQVNTDDIIQAMFWMQTDNVNRGDFDSSIAWGICADPTATAADTMCGMGLYTRAFVTGTNTALGVWAVNSSITGGNSNPTPTDRCIVTCQYGGGNVGSGTYMVVDNQGVRRLGGSRNGNISIPGSHTVKLILGVGTNGNNETIATGDESQYFKAQYAAIKTDLGAVL